MKSNIFKILSLLIICYTVLGHLSLGKAHWS